MNLGPEEIESRIKVLFYKGVVFEKEKEDQIIYKAPRHLIQLHDASVQWPDAPDEFYEIWNEFMEQEYPKLLELMMSAGIPAFMRTIPASGTISNFPEVLPYEDVNSMIESAEKIAVVNCPCRLSVKACDAEIETCIQFDKGANYNIKRGTGREIDKEEALKIVIKSEESGLVHTVETRPGLGNVLCNCCTCCCAILIPFLKGGKLREILKPSRYLAIIDQEQCICDGLCVDICPTGAIKMENGSEIEIEDEICIGCGLCIKECSTGALSFKQIRNVEFIS